MTEDNCVTCGTGAQIQVQSCPDCGSQMEIGEGCTVCMVCGFSPCK